MWISEVVAFLEGVKTTEGDLEVQSITGFWVQTIPATGKRTVISAVGEGRSVEQVLRGE